MAYQVLARKWRPKKFADLVGQEHVVRALQNAIAQGRLHHAYLLTGTRGVGKTTIARILAKSLNCEAAVAGEPCGICSTCTQIDAGRYVDLLEIDAASNTGIDNIREVLENAQYAPTSGKYKVYIIDEVHMLSKSAFNAMLKTLEEPPEHVKFILATTDPHKVPITVLSRCLQFVLRNLNAQQVSNHLAHVLKTEQIEYEAPALNLLGQAARGSMRDALSLLDQAIALSQGTVTENDVRQMMGAVDKQYIYSMLSALAQNDANSLIEQAKELANRAVGFDNTLSELATVLQQLAMLKQVPQALSDHPDFNVLTQLAAQFSGEEIQLDYQCLIHGKADLNLAPDEYSGFLMTLLRLLAFKPMAANAVPLDHQIAQSELTDPPATIVKMETAGSEVEKAVSIVPDAPKPANVSSTEAVVDSEEAHEETPPWIEEAESPEYSSNFAEASEVNEVEKKTHLNEQIQDSHQELADHASVTIEHDQLAKMDLPSLEKKHWVEIVSIIRHRLGATQMLVEHVALVDVDADKQMLTLALAKEGSLWAKRDNIQKLSDVISEAYQQTWQITTEDWTEECGFETPHQVQLRIASENKSEAVAKLEQDATAQAIVETFGGQWLPESIELIPKT